MMFVADLVAELNEEIAWLIENGQADRAKCLSRRLSQAALRHIDRHNAVLGLHEIAQNTASKQADIGNRLLRPELNDDES